MLSHFGGSNYVVDLSNECFEIFVSIDWFLSKYYFEKILTQHSQVFSE